VKISIVTLSYNQQAYLREALDSVLSQGFGELEYIVVDPGSTDGSRELIKSYGDKIAHTIFEPDRGAADGLNKGFGMATGDIFGFLNADDLLFPGSLSHVADFFSTHPDCDMAMGDGYTIDGKGRKLRHYRARDFTITRFFYGGARWLQQSTFFRASVFSRSPRFNLQNRTCWDGELFVNLANQGARIGYIHADLAGFRIHEASISGSGRLNDQFRADSRRIFRQLRGRDWNASDDLLSYFYRAEGFLAGLGSRFREPAEKSLQ
jgi:glycosyltransferase involved in cell wall biosynthesis